MPENEKSYKKHQCDGDINCNWRTWNDPKGLVKGLEELENRRTSKDHPNSTMLPLADLNNAFIVEVG